MKLEQLEHFVAVVEHGSLRAAARSLQVAQPALTRSIRLLEKELGAALFVRSITGMTVTPAGCQFLRRARTVINDLRRAAEEVRQTDGDDRGNVTVALSIMPHVGMLPGALLDFRRRWPRVRIEILEGPLPDIEQGLRDGRIDFYIGIAPQDMLAPGLMVQHLFTNQRAIFCRKGHPLSGARALKTLAAAEWAVTSVDYDASEHLSAIFRHHGLPSPEVIVRVRSVASILMGIAHSDAMAMLPIQCSQSPMSASMLHQVRVREELPPTPIVLIQRADVPLTPASEYFCDALLRQGPNVEHGPPRKRGTPRNQRRPAP